MEGKKIDSGAGFVIAFVASWLAWLCSATTAEASSDDTAAAGVAAAAKHFSSVHAVKFG
jgi:hypothetical protein